MNKRTYIYYTYMGKEYQFAFDETFHGPIRNEDSDLVCAVIKEETATVAYIMHALTRDELMRVVYPS